MIEISVDSLLVKAGRKTLLKIDHLVLSSSNIYGIVGPNGSGKSTFLKVLSGVTDSYSGNIGINGLNLRVNKLSLSKKMGNLIENPSFYPYSTPMEYITFQAEMRSGRKMENLKQPEDILLKVGLSAKKNERIGVFSTGELKRLGIASAFVGDPEIILLDEPTENLDIFGKDLIHDLLNEYVKLENKILIVTSHDLPFVEKVCNEIFFLKNGYMSGPMELKIITRTTVYFHENITEKTIPVELNVIHRGENFLTVMGDFNLLLDYALKNGLRIKKIETDNPLSKKYKEIFSD